jgi:hypothetical protein
VAGSYAAGPGGLPALAVQGPGEPGPDQRHEMGPRSGVVHLGSPAQPGCRAGSGTGVASIGSGSVHVTHPCLPPRPSAAQVTAAGGPVMVGRAVFPDPTSPSRPDTQHPP